MPPRGAPRSAAHPVTEKPPKHDFRVTLFMFSCYPLPNKPTELTAALTPRPHEVTDLRSMHFPTLDIRSARLTFDDSVINKRLAMIIGGKTFSIPNVLASVMTISTGKHDFTPLFEKELSKEESVVLLQLALMPHKFAAEMRKQARSPPFCKNGLWSLCFEMPSDGPALMKYAERLVEYFDFGRKDTEEQMQVHTELLRVALGHFYAFALFGPISVLGAPLNQELVDGRGEIGSACDAFRHLPLDLIGTENPGLFQENLDFITRFAVFHRPIIWLLAYQSAFHRTFVRTIEKFMDRRSVPREEEGEVVEVVKRRMASTKTPLTVQTKTLFYEFAAHYLSDEGVKDNAWKASRLSQGFPTNL
jgi:hypothetical protein